MRNLFSKLNFWLSVKQAANLFIKFIVSATGCFTISCTTYYVGCAMLKIYVVFFLLIKLFEPFTFLKHIKTTKLIFERKFTRIFLPI